MFKVERKKVMKKNYIQPMIETMPVRFVEIICNASPTKQIGVTDEEVSQETQVF